MSVLALHQSEGGGRQAGQQVSEIILRSHAGPPDQNPAWPLRFFYGFARSFWSSYRFTKDRSGCPRGIRRVFAFDQLWPPNERHARFHSRSKPAVSGSLLAKRSTRVYLPGNATEGISPEIILFGYPLRKEFRRIPRERARKQLGVAQGDRLLVVLGGSQGAASLNRWVKQNIEELAKEGISTYCLTGMNKESSGVVQLDGPIGQTITSRFVPFTDEMNAVLSAADLVLTRAGAGAIAEIVRCRPLILVPILMLRTTTSISMQVERKGRHRLRGGKLDLSCSMKFASHVQRGIPGHLEKKFFSMDGAA